MVETAPKLLLRRTVFSVLLFIGGGISRTIEQCVEPPYLVIDGRRMIPDFEEMVAHGYSYLAVGSPYLAAGATK